MSTNSNRMAVNAAIEKLIEQDDAEGESARVVIEYGATLKKAGPVQIQFSSNSTSSGSEVSGHSPGHGEITVKDEPREEEKEWTFGVHKDRIGYYRLWKEDEGELRFHHFWKSSITTMSMDGGTPDEYHLGYDKNSLEPEYLGIRRRKVIFKFWLGFTVEVSRFYLEQIYGAVPTFRMIGIRFY